MPCPRVVLRGNGPGSRGASVWRGARHGFSDVRRGSRCGAQDRIRRSACRGARRRDGGLLPAAGVAEGAPVPGGAVQCSSGCPAESGAAGRESGAALERTSQPRTGVAAEACRGS
ncbi:hypothetical protein GCM10027440_35110 [Nocardiopsis coralliicola]